MADLSDLLTPQAYGGAFGTGTLEEEGSRKPSLLANLLLGIPGRVRELAGMSMQPSDHSQEQTRFTTASPLVNITNEDIDRGINVGMAAGPGSIKAYHGSPHDFDKFDLSKIGTGEGAQAYGHGLYFADSEGVAKSYRDQLKSQAFNFDGKTMPRDQAVDALAERVRQAMPEAKQPSSAAQMVADWTQNGLTPPQIEARINAGAWPESLKGEIRAAAQVVQNSIKPNPGHMYEVNINADPSHFLDWDKPLSQQHPQTQEALKNLGVDISNQKTSDWHYQLTHGELQGNKPAVSSDLREAGIPGIKYLDQGSRGAGEGSSNYVVFNDKLIDIMRKYGFLLPGAGAAVAAEAVANADKQRNGT